MTDRTKALVDGPPETIDGFEVGTTVAPNTTIVGDADLYDVPPEVEAIAAWNTRASAPDTVTLDRALVEDDFAPIWDDSILLTEHKAVHASVAVGGWLSAALDDPNVCDAMKADVNRWFSAGFLYLDEVRKIMQAHRIASDLAGYERGQRETVERIVAWLRKPLTLIRGISMAQNERLSDAIEAGEWK